MVIIKSRWQYPIEYYRLRLRQFTKKVPISMITIKSLPFLKKRNEKHYKAEKGRQYQLPKSKDTQMSFGRKT